VNDHRSSAQTNNNMKATSAAISADVLANLALTYGVAPPNKHSCYLRGIGQRY
jgi:hypothetical protein